MRSYMRVLRGITLVGQLGFSLITPPVVMALLALWLQRRFGLGTWVMVVAIVVGLLSAGMNGYNFCRRVTASARKKDKDPSEKPVVFYQHE